MIQEIFDRFMMPEYEIIVEEKNPYPIPDYVSGRFRTQETCNEAVSIEPRHLAFVPDHFITQEMCTMCTRLCATTHTC